MLSLSVVLLLISVVLVSSQSPPEFSVVFQTTKGEFELYLNRSWSPIGVDHFYTLIQSEYYNQNAFFRVIQTPYPFVAQFGIAGDPAVSEKWNITIENDPFVGNSNIAGTVAYAAEMNGTQACCRTTQLFINYGDNSRLDSMGFVPIGKITSGFDITTQFYSGYGESPDQTLIYSEGNEYLQENFPLLDYIVSAKLVS